MAHHPIIALLTDFGISDHYVGTMKGVMLGICPEAVFVDVTHEIPPQDILTATLELASACRFFPPATIFLVVVDPGVGSARRAVAVEAGEYRFVAPDNGVLTGVFDLLPSKRAVELTSVRFMLSDVSRTFEGRDRFAPAAAWLAQGISLDEFGPAVADLQTIEIPRPSISSNGIDGLVLRIDRFGNLITNIDRRTFEALPAGESTSIQIGSHQILNPVSTYADAAPGEICALFGSGDQLEIAARGSNAAMLLAVGPGAAVHVGRPRDSISTENR